MRVLMVTSFPIPGEYDGTAMLPIKILRALKPRGVDVVTIKTRIVLGSIRQGVVAKAQA